MSEYGSVIEPGTVRFERLLPGPIEKVWAHLVDAELRGTWLATGPMEPREGGKVELHFRHADLTPHAEVTPEKYKGVEGGHTMSGRITRWDPPRLLAYTWEGDSEVTFELAPSGAGVRLTLTHRRLASRDETVEVSGGWHAHLGVLEERLRGETPRPFWPRFENLEREYQARIC